MANGIHIITTLGMIILVGLIITTVAASGNKCQLLDLSIIIYMAYHILALILWSIKQDSSSSAAFNSDGKGTVMGMWANWQLLCAQFKFDFNCSIPCFPHSVSCNGKTYIGDGVAACTSSGSYISYHSKLKHCQQFSIDGYAYYCY